MYNVTETKIYTEMIPYNPCGYDCTVVDERKGEKYKGTFLQFIDDENYIVCLLRLKNHLVRSFCLHKETKLYIHNTKNNLNK